MESQDVLFIRYIVESIAEFPEAVEIERTIDERGVLLTLKVDKRDAAKIIGKQGHTIIAMRVLLRVIGSKINAKIGLKMHDSLVLNPNKNPFDEKYTG